MKGGKEGGIFILKNKKDDGCCYQDSKGEKNGFPRIILDFSLMNRTRILRMEVIHWGCWPFRHSRRASSEPETGQPQKSFNKTEERRYQGKV